MQEIVLAVEKHLNSILEAERYIWQNPETGYKEYKTSAYLAEVFRSLGYELNMAENIPGFYTVFDTGRPGPEILVLGEMDSVICPEHPESDSITGAVHSCGHNAQCAALIGIAAALKEPGITDMLCGRIRLCAVPAEELLEIEYRSKLISQGKIKYFGGKTEFLYRGYFDGVDMAILVHPSFNFSIQKGFIGCIAKKIVYKGVAAHAGSSPWDGKNALYAANCGINAVNAIRETFKEDNTIRFHPIITEGGAMVNAVPEKVVLESYVRGVSFDAIEEANYRINRALCGAALSLGTNIEIIDTPGYAPMLNTPGLMEVTVDAAQLVIPERNFTISDTMSTGSSDMGDLSCVMPVVHPYVAGVSGRPHGDDFQISDPVAACVDNAKLQLTMLRILLSDDAQRAKKIISENKAPFATKEEYFKYLERFKKSGNRIIYSDDETLAQVKF